MHERFTVTTENKGPPMEVKVELEKWCYRISPLSMLMDPGCIS